MTGTGLLAAALAAVTAFAVPAGAGSQVGPPAGPVLTLDAALDQARQHNRPLTVDRLEADKAAQRLAAFRSQKKPTFDIRVTTGSLVFPMNFSFPVGAFGVFPTTGPIPPADTTITNNPRLSAVFLANVVQPLTQLRRLGHGEQAVALGRDVAAEQVRARELEVVAGVRSLYYGIVQAEAALRAREESIRLFRELARVTEQYAAQQVVLPAEVLAVRAGLQQQEHEQAALRNAATGFREKLNALLARNIDEPFQIQPLPAATMDDVGLPASEERAVASRPEVRLRRLQAEQAAFDLKATATPGMPDFNLSFAFTGFWGFQVLPPAGGLIGVQGQWEPWDWGRRKAEREARRLTHEQALKGVAEAEAMVRVDVRARFRAVQEAFDRLRVCDAAREAARERLRVAGERVSREAAIERDQIDAQARLAQADSDCQQALAAYWTARAELERARADQ